MSFFILIFIFLLVIAVYAVSSLLATFFSAEKRGYFIIILILTLCSSGFILAQYLVHSFDNLFIRIFYLILSLIIGFLFYLSISAILFKITKLIIKPQKYLLASKWGVFLALSLFLIGVFNANFSEVKNISVSLNNLPKNWQGKRIVQISDIHLGNIYGPKFLARQVDKINALEPDLIVITGDLFDGTPGRLAEFSSGLARLKAKEGVIFASGNHDTYLGLDKVDAALNQAGIRILHDEMINLDGLEIIGFDFNKFIGNDTLRSIKNLGPYNSARILLNHTPNDIALAKKLEVNLQLSGHSHHGQMFPMSFVTGLIYGKYQYGLNTEGLYNIYTSSGLGSWGPPVRTFNPAEIVLITLK